VPAIVTKQFRVRNAKDFMSKLLGPTEAGSNAYDGVNYIYLTFGKPIPWDETNFGSDDTNPPDPDDDIATYYNVYRDGLAAAPVETGDTSLGIRRYNWTSGTVYSQYDDQDPTIANGTAVYFVYEPNTGDIFKCLENNNGAASTVRPTKPGAGSTEVSFVTSDGYKWKFMAQTPTTAQKFLTTNFAPILSVNVHPDASAPAGYADQEIVQQRANTGSLEAYVVTSGGVGFVKHSGAATTKTIASSANCTVFTLTTDSAIDSFVDDALIGATIHVEYAANGNTSTGVISDWVQGTRTVTLESPGLDFRPAPSDTYEIGPTVWVTGDGRGANAYTICTASGIIQKVKTLGANTGNSYTYATVSVDPNSQDSGSGASIRAIIPPPGGHGNDPADELNGFNILINKTVDGFGGTGNNYPVSNDYRVVSLLRNPLLANGHNQDVLVPATSGANWFANTDTVHMSTWVVCNTADSAHGSLEDGTQVWEDWNSRSGPLPDDEVEGVNSGAKGRVVEFNSDGRGILNISNVVANSSGGIFDPREAIRLTRTYTGYVPSGNNYIIANGYSEGWSADTTTIPGTTFDVVQEGELQTGTGEVLYIENRQPILRSTEQRETVTIVIEF
jgi:hypothetical protein